MNELLRKLFDNVVSNEKETIEVNKQVDTKVHTILEQYKQQLTTEEFEKLSADFYYIALFSQQEGFELGMKYLLKLVIALLSKS